jgi:sulfur carrier protein
MNIYVEKDNRSLTLKEKHTGKSLLEFLAINPSTVLIVKNNEIVLEDESLEPGDEIKILSVISGG